jgi:hypothetical protein
MSYYATEPLPPLMPTPPPPASPDRVWFWLVAALLTVVSWAYSLLVWAFAGSCATPATGWMLDDVRSTQRHLVTLLVVMAVLSLGGVAFWRGRRYAFGLAGLVWCVPLVLLLLAHPDPAMWHSNFCVGGP